MADVTENTNGTNKKKYLDLEGLTYFKDAMTEYVDDKTVVIHCNIDSENAEPGPTDNSILLNNFPHTANEILTMIEDEKRVIVEAYMADLGGKFYLNYIGCSSDDQSVIFSVNVATETLLVMIQDDVAILMIEFNEPTDYVTQGDYSPVTSNAVYNEISSINDRISSHNHNTSYYQKNEIDGFLLNKVDNTVKINNKPLSSDITLTASDVGALPSNTPLFSGSYNDLSNKPTIPSIDGLATENYVDVEIGKISIPTKLSDLTADNDHKTVTNAEKQAWNAKSDFDGSYNSLKNKPTIPTSNDYYGKGAGDELAVTLQNVKKDVDNFFKDALGDTEAEQVKNTLREIQNYIASDETGAAAMIESINGKAEKATTISGYGITDAYTKNEINNKIDTINNTYLPLSGGNITGHVYLTGSKETSSTGNTSQIVFGTQENNHVAISSNTNAIVINPNASQTTNQIVLYLDKPSMFPSGIQGNASSASRVNKSLSVKLNGGTTEGTNLFTFNGSADKAINITPSSIGAATASTVTGHIDNKSNPHGVTLSQLGVTATAAALNYVDGVTSKIQEQLDSKQDTITGGATTIASTNLTTSRALVSSSSGKVAVSDVTSTELGYLDGVTSNVQTQLDGKANKSQAIFYIEGSSSSTTDTTNKVATWIGSHNEITSYFNGLTILYKVVTAGSTTTTLNINNLGAVNVVRNATTGISTACPVDGVLLLTYTVDSSGTAYWKTADYDANTKNTAGTSNKTGSKMYLVGGTSQSSSGVTTYTNKNCYIGTDNELYSNGKKVVTDTSGLQAKITGTAGQFVVIGSGGKPTTMTITYAEEGTF